MEEMEPYTCPECSGPLAPDAAMTEPVVTLFVHAETCPFYKSERERELDARVRELKAKKQVEKGGV